MTNEEYVKSKWEKVHYVESRGYSPYSCGIVYCKAPYGESSEWLLSGPLDLPKAAAWQAAADFTRAHEEEIRQVEREIEALTRNSYAGCEDYYQVIERDRDIVGRVRHHHALCRILAARQAALDALRKGWKG